MADLLALALRAIDDADALPVLGDAIQEAAWFDRRIAGLMRDGAPWPRSKKRRRIVRKDVRAGSPTEFAKWVANPSTTFARAVAAVLLFGGWSHLPWPPATRGSFPFTSMAWHFGENDPSPLFGMIPKTQDFTPPPPPRDVYERLLRVSREIADRRASTEKESTSSGDT